MTGKFSCFPSSVLCSHTPSHYPHTKKKHNHTHAHRSGHRASFVTVNVNHYSVRQHRPSWLKRPATSTGPFKFTHTCTSSPKSSPPGSSEIRYKITNSADLTIQLIQVCASCKQFHKIFCSCPVCKYNDHYIIPTPTDSCWVGLLCHVNVYFASWYIYLHFVYRWDGLDYPHDP